MALRLLLIGGSHGGCCICCGRCDWFRYERSPPGPRGIAAVIRPLHWICFEVRKIPVVETLFFNSLGRQQGRALIEAGPQGCHVFIRVGGCHDGIVNDQGIEVGSPSKQPLLIGWAVPFGVDRLGRFDQSHLSPNRRSNGMGATGFFGRLFAV